jgi:hypothetical protein
MPKPMDITGLRVGRLVAVEPLRSGAGGRIWRIACDCGNMIEKRVGEYRHGDAQSCGCLRAEKSRTLGYKNFKHGEGHSNKTPEYRAWSGMKERCFNPKKDNYPAYGGRGISVCERWRDSYENFLSDVGRRPGPAYSLDRIDPDGNYEPGNVRWATRTTQQSNRRNTVYFHMHGQKIPAARLAQMAGFHRNDLYKFVSVLRYLEANHDVQLDGLAIECRA